MKNEYTNVCLEGFIKGAKKTPLGYFSPAVAAWRLCKWIFLYMVNLTNELMAGTGNKKV